MVMSDNVFKARGRGPRTTHVVLVVADERVERASAAAHLRQAGFDVVEAADGDEARRVLEAVCVDIVLTDLAASGQTNGLSLLHWLREHHPTVKTILTSATETGVAALSGYGIFLSKPYRPIDLDYCLHKVLADASGQGAAAGPEPGTAPAVDAHSRRPSARDSVDSVRQRMVDLSRRLGERMRRQAAVGSIAVAGAHRAAVQTCERARRRPVIAGASIAVAAIASAAIVSAAIAWFAVPVDSAVAPPLSTAGISAASTVPAPPLADSPPPSAPAAVASAPSTPQPAETVQSEVPLRPDEVREVQARLRSFGFNPGLVDGIAGPMSVEAATRYQQDRGQPQTGRIDGALLEQLRQDPAPQVTAPAPRPAARRSDPFEAVRAAGDRLSRWLGSLTR